ncbi:type I pullulanase [Roseivirga misakiensis]|uniref:Type I pullulanase n=1 Tax=Roseivirga misakiensis TaxID=1563681 RepID=A0A1E5T1E3_9BACT|nr:type I pullulanase [Roseivirga misakiensis]OEK05190.1 type I pullulanase [Roseivirga misakiensis]
MKQILSSIILLFILLMSCDSIVTYESFDDFPVYEGNDLGATYSKSGTTFKMWSPEAQEVKLNLYSAGDGDNLVETFAMKKAKNGVWTFKIKGDVESSYYTYKVMQKGQWLQEKPDLYAEAVGVNGQRSMVVDLSTTDPKGWENDKRPAMKNYTDIILYELHIRDMSIHESSGAKNKGKYLAFTESGTKSPQNLTTGMDHMKELGITHAHLLPTFDHKSIDETRLDEAQYNWGYDPLNYNVPEGSFSTDPYDGKVRIREFKEMVKAFHDNGIRVILDVVYNHTGQTEDSNFNQLVPNYFYRQNLEGGFSDASACGNETASERYMMRKYMVESVKHWVNEYHLDGFRFDLMGIHDIETMNEVSAAVRAIDPTIFVYGEGWTAGASPLPSEQQALKANTYKMEKVSAFSDDLRDGLKGSVFEHEQRGFVSQGKGMKESIKFGIVASTQHPQLDYKAVNYSDAPWASEPSQTISYVSCHDNHTLYDRLKISNPEASEAELIQMHKLAETIVLTSQGVPFIHAGMEMLRTKNGEENSYQSPDEINQIDWNRKAEYIDLFNYYKALIALRKNHPAFRMPDTEMIQEHLEFIDTDGENFLGYQIKDNANGDSWKNILVLLNGSDLNKTIALPKGEWTLVNDGSQINESGIGRKRSGSLTVKARTPLILMKN